MNLVGRLFVGGLLWLGGYGPVVAQPVDCSKLADCAQRLVQIATRLQDENRQLAERIAALESIQSGVVAFNLDRCPAGWEPYSPSFGRFIRGVDPSNTARARGSFEEDAFQGHTFVDPADSTYRFRFTRDLRATGHTSGYSNMWDTGIFGFNAAYGKTYEPAIGSDGQNGSPRVANETRPKNVALLYCQKK